MWLVTHSDAILRGSVGREDFSVFHIVPSAYIQPGKNQARHVQADEDLEKAIIEMVGDLAAYSPGGRVVIFEGEDSDFDLRMASDLFPELPVKANLVSGTNKARVRGLHTILQRLSSSNKLAAYQVFSITDRDSDPVEESQPLNRYSWDVYHIENYLLEPKYINVVLSDLSGGRHVLNEDQIEETLISCAAEIVSSLVIHSTSQILNKLLVSAIRTDIDPNSFNIAGDLASAISNSRGRIDQLVNDKLSEEAVSQLVSKTNAELQTDLLSGNWKKTFRGRDILRRFVGKHGYGVRYEIFRNLIVSRMRDGEFRPQGMKTILDTILAPQPIRS